MIILYDFLPYYRFWQPNDARSNQELLALYLHAYQIWEGDLVTANPNGTFTVIAPPYACSSDSHPCDRLTP